MTLESQLETNYGLTDTQIEHLNTYANYAVAVTTPNEKFALKLYNPNSRIQKDVEWEIALTLHLLNKHVPIAKPIKGKEGYVSTFQVDGEERAAVLFEWVQGEKPKPTHETYLLLGQAAALIHKATDDFISNLPRETYDARELIDEQLRLMKEPLTSAGEWNRIFDLSERLKKYLTIELDYGICHMDLTLDNVHVKDGKMTTFDLDSAAISWRAIEPYLVLNSSEEHFRTWLEGYRTTRPFDEVNERAVYAFVIIGEIRNITWKLGLAKSSRGKPLLTPKELPKVIDDWLEWESKYLA